MSIKAIIFFIFLILLAVVLIQNTEVIDVQLLFWKLSMSRIILIVIPLFIGFFVGLFTSRKISIR